MSDIELPLFPLPLVVFPGTPQPLHIFEPRYRELLEDCLAGDGRFGISVAYPKKTGSDLPHPGDVGCTSRIQSHHALPDGRANVLVIGEERFVFKELLERDRLYYVGLVELFYDAAGEDPDLPRAAGRLRNTFLELMRVMQQDTPVSDHVPKLPDDPEGLSFYVAAALHADLETKEGLLRLTSTKVRLERLRQLVKPQIVQAARRASVHRLAKGNGKARHVLDSSIE
jgi:ATP-dependent Lon protease